MSMQRALDLCIRIPFESFVEERLFAKCFRIGGRDVWFRSSNIITESKTEITVPEWVARAKRIGGYE